MLNIDVMTNGGDCFFVFFVLQMVKAGLSANSLLDRGVQLMGDLSR